jgi:hypothetical protein
MSKPFAQKKKKVCQTFTCLQSVWSPSARNEENDCARLTANPFQGHAASRPPLDVWFLQKVWQTFSFLQSVWSQSAHNEQNDSVRLTANPFPGHADSRTSPGRAVSSKSLADFFMSAVSLESDCTQ